MAGELLIKEEIPTSESWEADFSARPLLSLLKGAAPSPIKGAAPSSIKGAAPSPIEGATFLETTTSVAGAISLEVAGGLMAICSEERGMSFSWFPQQEHRLFSFLPLLL